MSEAAPARCFVALIPPPEVLDRLTALQGGDEGVRWIQPGQLHVTMRFLGDVDREAATSAVSRVHHPPVDVALGPATAAMFGVVIAVPVSGVDTLAAEVLARTVEVTPDDGPPFVGHLTLGRLPSRRQSLVAEPVSLGWRADRIVLVESRPSAGRHEHEILAEVPLGS